MKVFLNVLNILSSVFMFLVIIKVIPNYFEEWGVGWFVPVFIGQRFLDAFFMRLKYGSL